MKNHWPEMLTQLPLSLSDTLAGYLNRQGQKVYKAATVTELHNQPKCLSTITILLLVHHIYITEQHTSEIESEYWVLLCPSLI